MSSIMEPIGPELSELSALEFENLPNSLEVCFVQINFTSVVIPKRFYGS